MNPRSHFRYSWIQHLKCYYRTWSPLLLTLSSFAVAQSQDGSQDNWAQHGVGAAYSLPVWAHLDHMPRSEPITEAREIQASY